MNSGKLRISLTVKLISLIVAVCALSLSVQSIISFRVSKKSLTASVDNYLLSVASDVSHRMAANNEKEFSIIRVLADMDEFKDEEVSSEEKARLLNDTVSRMDKRYENIAWYDSNGDSIIAKGKTVNFSDRPYFSKTIKGNETIAGPAFSPVTQTYLMHYGVPVYGTQSGKIIGCIILVLRGNPLFDMVKKIDIGAGMHPLIVNRKSGATLADANSPEGAESTNLNDVGGNGAPKDVVSSIISGETGTRDILDPSTKLRMTCAYTPVDQSDWAVLCTVPYSHSFAGLITLQKITAVILAASLVFAGLLCSVFIAVIVKPLKVVKNSIMEISSGNADLTQRIPDASNDEIGDVVAGFNQFISKLQEIVKEIQNSEEDLAQVDRNLQKSTHEASSSIGEIISNIEGIKDQIDNQGKSVVSTAGAVNEIASNIESLEKMIDTQASGVTQASSAVEEMLGNIKSVNHSVDIMLDSFKSLEKKAAEGADNQSNANDMIHTIEQESITLQDANTAIASIAEQTNLLAMNAAIEAAHAGEAGKGFSVVADEIRKLSETSSAQSKTIGDELKKIQETIQSVVNASNSVSASFNDMAESVQTTDHVVQQIKAAMDEQQVGSQQIISALKTMNDSTHEVKAASSEMAAGNRQILDEIKHLQDATSIIQEGMEQMARGASSISETGTTLSGISGNVTDSITKIGNQINQFRA